MLKSCTKQTHTFIFLFESPVCGSFRSLNGVMMRLGEVFFYSAQKKNNLAAADKQNDWEAVLCICVVFSGLYKLLRILYSDVFALFVSLSPSAVAAGRRFPARLRGRASLQWESWRRGSSRLWPERSVGKGARGNAKRRVQTSTTGGWLRCECSAQQVIIWRKLLGGLFLMRWHQLQGHAD